MKLPWVLLSVCHQCSSQCTLLEKKRWKHTIYLCTLKRQILKKGLCTTVKIINNTVINSKLIPLCNSMFVRCQQSVGAGHARSPNWGRVLIIYKDTHPLLVAYNRSGRHLCIISQVCGGWVSADLCRGSNPSAAPSSLPPSEPAAQAFLYLYQTNLWTSVLCHYPSEPLTIAQWVLVPCITLIVMVSPEVCISAACGVLL